MKTVLKILLDGEEKIAVRSPRIEHYFILNNKGIKVSEISLKGICEHQTAICGGHKYRLLNEYIVNNGKTYMFCDKIK